MPVSQRDGRYKWILLGFLFVTFFLQQGMRQIYNAVLPQIKIDFSALGVTDMQFGLVGTVFSAVFGLSLVASGVAADFMGRKRVLVLGTLLFSIGVFGTGFATGVVTLICLYGVLNAVGQCCVAPPGYSLISQHHVDTRSVAMSIFQAAVYLGVVLSGLFAGRMAEIGAGGWRWAFWLTGGLGVLWACAMHVCLRESPQVGAEERPSMKAAFEALVKKPTAVLIAVAFGMFMYAQLGIRLWTPMFMVRHYEGVGIARAALHSVLWLNVSALASSLAVAKVIDRLAVRRPRVKLEVSALDMALCIVPVVLFARCETFAGSCLALSLYGITYGIYDASHYPAMFDCVAPRYRSVTTGLTGCYAFLFGSLAPAALGWIGERFCMRTAFSSLSAFYLAGALILLPAIFRHFDKDYIATPRTP